MGKRVVTGHDDRGKAIVVSRDEVEPTVIQMAPGHEFGLVWSGDEPPSFPDGGERPETPVYFPAPGGFRFMTVTFPPDSYRPAEKVDVPAALVEADEKLPGMMAHMERDTPGMHTSATVDYDYLVSGRLVLELDDGATVELEPGDCVIQNGTRHRWSNPYDEPAVMVVTLIGAHHTNVP